MSMSVDKEKTRQRFMPSITALLGMCHDYAGGDGEESQYFCEEMEPVFDQLGLANMDEVYGNTSLWQNDERVPDSLKKQLLSPALLNVLRTEYFLEFTNHGEVAAVAAEEEKKTPPPVQVQRKRNRDIVLRSSLPTPEETVILGLISGKKRNHCWASSSGRVSMQRLERAKAELDNLKLKYAKIRLDLLQTI